MTRPDPRYFQIATLSCLIALTFFWSDFGTDPLAAVVTVLSAVMTQWAGSRLAGLPQTDFRSPLITSFSLILLLRSNDIWIYALAAVIGIGSKFVLRFDNKHVFNPANIAIVSLLLICPAFVWVSPGQWGSAVWLIVLLACSAALVLASARRADIAFFFLFAWGALLFGRALWLGDPLSIPLHQLQSGALLIFTFFMITDPKTAPENRWARFIFAAFVAGIAGVLQFEFQIREALFYALAIGCLAVPFLNRILQGETYQWRKLCP